VSTRKKREGFTLIELLLVVGVVSVVSGIVVVAVAPRKTFITARDLERRHASHQMSKAIATLQIDQWELPANIPEGEVNALPICRIKAGFSDNDCINAGGVPLSMLPPEYIPEITKDIVMPVDSNCTGYMVYQEVGRPYVYSANLGKLEGDSPAVESTCPLPGWISLGAPPEPNSALLPVIYASVVNGGNMYVVGSFVNVGGDPDADLVAMWDGSSWHPVGDSIFPMFGIRTLAFYGGKLYIGGFGRLSVLEGGVWQDVGGANIGFDYVYTLKEYNGKLYVGGSFMDIGGVADADFLATWDGLSWEAVGPQYLNNVVHTLDVHGGNLYVGGRFTEQAGDNLNHIAMWDGASWNNLNSGLSAGFNLYVFSMATYNGLLHVGGQFLDAGGDPDADKIATWDSGTSTWANVGGDQLNRDVLALHVHGSDLFVGGKFNNGAGIPEADKIIKWDGTTWSGIDQDGFGDALLQNVHTITTFGSQVCVGGEFEDAGGNEDADAIACFTP